MPAETNRNRGQYPEPMRRIRTAIFGVVALCATAVLPAAAAADCSLPTGNGGNDSSLLGGGTVQTFGGKFGPGLNGKFIQIPFDVGEGITGMKIRYCFAKADGGASDDNPTLDLGVYGPKPLDAPMWEQPQRRGWSGSALRTIGIGVNGYTDTSTYNGGRKDYVPGYTTRAYKPGPVQSGQWAVELGAGWIDPDGAGVDWKVEVTTSNAPEWANDPFVPEPYTPYSANPDAGWYTGDFHVHGEMEPGNAPMTDTLDLGFKPVSEGGGGLDFMTLVDHNNDNSLGILGQDQYRRDGKLVIPGIEVTTYDGHWNATGSENFADFRFSDVYKWNDGSNGGAEDGIQTDSELELVRPEIDPASQLQPVLDGNGFTQVNHPETLRAAPASCRGCAWTYPDDRTGWQRITALEIQNGAAGVVMPTPTAMNPFTVAAIATYERLLADGFHIAAVGSSDDHQAGGATGGFDGQVGKGATVVHAEELSRDGVVEAVKAGHTYVKPFGADAPDVELVAGPSAQSNLTALPGDSVNGPPMKIEVKVRNGGSSAARPGPYTLEILQDGISIDSVAVTSDDFDHELTVTETGRYSFKLTRPIGQSGVAIEAYSTPVWFTYAPPVAKPSNAFNFGAFKANRARGTATLKVRVASPGRIRMTAPGLNTRQVKVTKKNQTVTLNLQPKASLRKSLARKGSAKVRLKVTNTPTGGKSLSKSRTVKLLGKKKPKKRR